MAEQTIINLQQAYKEITITLKNKEYSIVADNRAIAHKIPSNHTLVFTGQVADSNNDLSRATKIKIGNTPIAPHIKIDTDHPVQIQGSALIAADSTQSALFATTPGGLANAGLTRNAKSKTNTVKAAESLDSVYTNTHSKPNSKSLLSSKFPENAKVVRIKDTAQSPRGQKGTTMEIAIEASPQGTARIDIIDPVSKEQLWTVTSSSTVEHDKQTYTVAATKSLEKIADFLKSPDALSKPSARLGAPIQVNQRSALGINEWLAGNTVVKPLSTIAPPTLSATLPFGAKAVAVTPSEAVKDAAKQAVANMPKAATPPSQPFNQAEPTTPVKLDTRQAHKQTGSAIALEMNELLDSKPATKQDPFGDPQLAAKKALIQKDSKLKLAITKAKSLADTLARTGELQDLNALQREMGTIAQQANGIGRDMKSHSEQERTAAKSLEEQMSRFNTGPKIRAATSSIKLANEIKEQLGILQKIRGNGPGEHKEGRGQFFVNEADLVGDPMRKLITAADRMIENSNFDPNAAQDFHKAAEEMQKGLKATIERFNSPEMANTLRKQLGPAAAESIKEVIGKLNNKVKEIEREQATNNDKRSQLLPKSVREMIAGTIGDVTPDSTGPVAPGGPRKSSARGAS